MKKLLLLVCAAVMSLSASAQAGDKALGAQLVFGSETNSLGFGVKGQYYFTDHILEVRVLLTTSSSARDFQCGM